MAHFAQLDDYDIVQQVIVVGNEILLDDSNVESEEKGIEFCKTICPGKWIQTSFGGNFRKNFAGIGYYYDRVRNAFIPPKPYASWMLNEDTCQWESPVPYPDDIRSYIWNEEQFKWEPI